LLAVKLEEDSPFLLLIRLAQGEVVNNKAFAIFEIDEDFFAGFRSAEKCRGGENFKVAELALMRRIVVVDLRVHQIGRKIVIMQLGVNLLFALHPCGF